MQGVLPSHLFFANRATSDFHLGIDCYQEATATPTKQRWHEGLQGVQEGKVSFLVILKPQWWNFFTPNKQPFFRIAMQRLLIFTSVGQDPKGAFLVKVKITANDEFRSPNLNLIPRNSDNIKPKKNMLSHNPPFTLQKVRLQETKGGIQHLWSNNKKEWCFWFWKGFG